LRYGGKKQHCFGGEKRTEEYHVKNKEGKLGIGGLEGGGTGGTRFFGVGGGLLGFVRRITLKKALSKRKFQDGWELKSGSLFRKGERGGGSTLTDSGRKNDSTLLIIEGIQWTARKGLPKAFARKKKGEGDGVIKEVRKKKDCRGLR